jgi:hypothetical protein
VDENCGFHRDFVEYQDVRMTRTFVLAHEYVRPLSRAAVTTIMKAYSTPSIAI